MHSTTFFLLVLSVILSVYGSNDSAFIKSHLAQLPVLMRRFTRAQVLAQVSLSSCLSLCQMHPQHGCLFVQHLLSEMSCTLVSVQDECMTSLLAHSNYSKVWKSSRYWDIINNFLIKGNPFLASREKPVSASSVHANGNIGLAYAVDGLKSDQCNVFFHTAEDYHPEHWLMVDLLEELKIVNVIIWDRPGTVGEVRFFRISVGVSTDTNVLSAWNWSKFLLCGFFEGPRAAGSDLRMDFYCSKNTGRLVAVRKDPLTTYEHYFHFCEMEIFALAEPYMLLYT